MFSPAYQEFLQERAPQSVLDLVYGSDISAVNDFYESELKSRCPSDWPPFHVALHPDNGRVYGVDFASAVLLLSVVTSPSPFLSESGGVKNLPASYWQIRDWIWIANSDVVWLWNNQAGTLQGLAGDAAKEAKRLHDALSNVRPGLAAYRAEPTMANMLLGLMRAIAVELHAEDTEKVLRSARERTGITAEDANYTAAAIRRTTFNHLLSRSPAFSTARVVVVCRKRMTETGEILPGIVFAKVLASVEECHKDSSVIDHTAMLAISRKDGEVVDTPVVITENDEAFAFYANNPIWGYLQISEWVLSPAALQRVSEWEDIVLGAL